MCGAGHRAWYQVGVSDVVPVRLLLDLTVNTGSQSGWVSLSCNSFFCTRD